MLPDQETVRLAARNAAACAARLRLPLLSRVWRGSAGELAGHGTGASMDFQDHRPYFPGDDPRHINWQAYARTGQYTMKLYREEVRPTVDVLLDVSPSMFLTPEKSLRAAELFHFAIHGAARAGANLAAHAIAGRTSTPLPLAAVLSSNWTSHVPAPDGAPDTHAIEPRALPARAGGLRILVSDLLFPGDPAPFLRALTQSHGTAILFVPYAAEEATPGWSGPCELLDVESDRKHDRQIDPAILKRYHTAYTAHFTAWKDAARRFRVPLARIPSAATLEHALATEALPARAVEASA
jgi:uncharacterized protein (DUF58 family)